jgi:DNA-binding response OmpR family regulator
VAKVLVVDDDDSILKLETKVLTAFGFEVRVAHSGLEALQAVREEEFQVVLLDLMMPGMSGLAVCRLLRADRRSAELPIIFVTAKGAEEASAAAVAAGGVRFLLKPFSASALVEEVRRAVAQSGGLG